MSSNTSDEPNGTEQKPATGSQGQPERVDEQPNARDGGGPSSNAAALPKPGIMARLGLDLPTIITMIK